MDTSLRIFYIGATGYLGGSVLKRILTVYPKAHVTALLRSEKDIDALKIFGVHEVVPGSLDDLGLIHTNAGSADLVFQCASADDENVMRAILEGMKERYQATGIRPVLFHTSGAGVFMDRSPGSMTEEAKSRPWDDLDEERLSSIPSNAVHRPIDEMIVKADSEGYIDGWIICPPLIYGQSTGPISRESVQVPALVGAIRSSGTAFYVGQGTSAWSNIHVDDCADLYEIVIGHALKPETRAQRTPPYSKYFFAESGIATWAELVAAISSTLHSVGALENRTPTSIPLSKAEEMFGPSVWGGCSNAICVANRARQLGWSPIRGDWRSAVRGDVERVAKNLTSIA